MPEAIEYAVTDGVATITLNRPDRLSALNPVMFGELMAVFDETDADDDVRAVIVTGAGPNWSLRPSRDLPGWFPWVSEPPYEV